MNPHILLELVLKSARCLFLTAAVTAPAAAVTGAAATVRHRGHGQDDRALREDWPLEVKLFFLLLLILLLLRQATVEEADPVSLEHLGLKKKGSRQPTTVTTSLHFSVLWFPFFFCSCFYDPTHSNPMSSAPAVLTGAPPGAHVWRQLH